MIAYLPASISLMTSLSLPIPDLEATLDRPALGLLSSKLSVLQEKGKG
jgi:hypothetical protein